MKPAGPMLTFRASPCRRPSSVPCPCLAGGDCGPPVRLRRKERGRGVAEGRFGVGTAFLPPAAAPRRSGPARAAPGAPLGPPAHAGQGESPLSGVRGRPPARGDALGSLSPRGAGRQIKKGLRIREAGGRAPRNASRRPRVAPARPHANASKGGREGPDCTEARGCRRRWAMPKGFFCGNMFIN